MSREEVRKTLEKLYEEGECHNRDIFINSSIMLSARGEKQYFEVAEGENCLVLFLWCNGYMTATILETNIERIYI